MSNIKGIPDKKIDKSGADQKVWLEVTTLNIMPGEQVKIKLTEKTKKELQPNVEFVEVSATIDKSGKALLLVGSEKIETTDFISNAFWVKDRSTEERVTFLPYKENNTERAFVLIKFKAKAVGRQATVRVYEYDRFSRSEKVYEFSFEIKYLSTNFSFNMHGSMFEKGESGGETASFFFEIKIDDSDYQEYCNTSSRRLKVHKIIYIPEIMKNKGWEKGYLLQNKWFEGKSSSTPKTKADIANIISMNWVLGFERAKAIYNKMIENKIWVNEAGKRALIKEINKMKTKKKLMLPTAEGQEVNFGTFSLSKTTNSKGEVAPEIDLYHYQERAYRESVFKDLDDLYAALANFVFRMAVKGKIKKVKNKYEITVLQVGTYIRDSFDFIDDGWTSQNLGYWSVSQKDVSKLPKSLSYTQIQNSNYQDYREESGYGMDFLVYSDVKIKTVNDKFTISKEQL